VLCGDVQVGWVEFVMMRSSWVIFGEIITQVVRALAPVDNKLILSDVILHPVESHIHCFGFLLPNGALGDPG
jgi:hypothetical protein